MPEHRIVRRVYNWSLTKGRSWEKKMLKFIDTHNLSDLMLAPNPNKSSCVSVARDILNDIDKDKKLMSDGNALN